jgi:DNA-binding transcriptional LysR family regulator
MSGFHGFFMTCVLLCKHGWVRRLHSLVDASISFRGITMATSMGSGDVDLSLLRTFLAVVQFGSLGKTAAAIDKTQPAISQQMIRLEKILGHRLFARGRTGVKLSHHGRLLISYANRAIDLNEEILLRLRGERTCGRVAMGMSTDVALVGLAPALKRFRSIHPDVEVRVTVTTPTRLDSLLRAGKLDLVIADPSGLAGTPAARWQVPMGWAAGKGLNIDRSRAVPLVLVESPCPWQDEMLESLRRAGWVWRVTFESASLDAILTATQSGLGIACLPTEAIRKFKLNCAQSVELPSPPSLQLGLFRSAALPSGARTMLEVALASLFGSDTEVPSTSIDFSHEASKESILLPALRY